MKRSLSLLVLALLLILPTSCKKKNAANQNNNNPNLPTVLCSTTMVADMAKNIAAGRFNVVSIVRPGDDPHTYEVKPSDTIKIKKAKVILLIGLHLEGEVGEMVEKHKGKDTLVAKLAEQKAIPPIVVSGSPDPHVWNNVLHFKAMTKMAMETLIKADPKGKEAITKAGNGYMKKLDDLHQDVKKKISSIPQAQRLLITTHDAFSYFSQAYGIEVKALVGITTEEKVTANMVVQLIETVKKRKIKAIFAENITPTLNKQLKKIAKQTGAKLPKTHLYSDSLGAEGSPAGTYIGMVQQNVDILLKHLK